jgi:NADH:ubiquinone oxidoreductase subunit F (NADH-binding)
MSLTTRTLPAQPVRKLDDYLDMGGGRGLVAARKLGPSAVVDEVEASGLRGRGGAGFPTGVKWRTVAELEAAVLPTTVVVNGAEGEPGTFKDRTLLRANPYAVLEGAVIAALAVDADRVIVAVKETFTRERERLEAAIAEARERTDWFEDVAIGVATGPSEYLFGEETALLEVLDGRPPFPRVTPPYRRGIDEIGRDPGQSAAGAVLAEPGPGGSPPVLANNVETLANVAPLLAEGADWFRSLGTPGSPGTILVTISGATGRHGVAEVEMGTPLGEAIELIGEGPQAGRRLVAALSGVANPIVPAELFDTPLTYEDMRTIGSGLGAAGFVVFDDRTDMAAVAAGVSRFLAVESCGQCTPCKQDGQAIAEALVRIVSGSGRGDDPAVVADRVSTVADEARCFLAQQHQLVVGSILQRFPEALERHRYHDDPRVEPEPILPIVDIVDGVAELDLHQLDKQPDWSYDAVDSGKAPVSRLARGGDPD